MKITVSDTQLEQIKSKRDIIQATLDDILAKNKTAQGLYSRKASLEAQLEELEKASPDDTTAIKTIANKRVELELATNKISELPEIGEAQTGALGSLLRELTFTIHTALMPCYEKTVEKIAESIRRYCRDDAKAISIARQTDAACNVVQTFLPRWGEFGSMVVQADAAIRLSDSILAGEIPVKFDSVIQYFQR